MQLVYQALSAVSAYICMTWINSPISLAALLKFHCSTLTEKPTESASHSCMTEHLIAANQLYGAWQNYCVRTLWDAPSWPDGLGSELHLSPAACTCRSAWSDSKSPLAPQGQGNGLHATVADPCEDLIEKTKLSERFKLGTKTPYQFEAAVSDDSFIHGCPAVQVSYCQPNGLIRAPVFVSIFIYTLNV